MSDAVSCNKASSLALSVIVKLQIINMKVCAMSHTKNCADNENQSQILIKINSSKALTLTE